MQLQKELLFGKCVEQHEHQYKKYFEVKTTPTRGIQVTAKADAIKAAKRYYGYFVLLSNEKMESVVSSSEASSIKQPTNC